MLTTKRTRSIMSKWAIDNYQHLNANFYIACNQFLLPAVLPWANVPSLYPPVPSPLRNSAAIKITKPNMWRTMHNTIWQAMYTCAQNC